MIDENAIRFKKSESLNEKIFITKQKNKNMNIIYKISPTGISIFENKNEFIFKRLL